MSQSVIANATGPIHAVVTGASRGIGLALVRALLASDSVVAVDALARHASRSPGLDALDSTRLDRIDIDLADAGAIDAYGQDVRARGTRVQLVIHAAGLLHEDGVQPEKALASIDSDALQRVFALNAFAPILLARALQPAVPVDTPCVFASLSARVGSIGDNALGGWYAYRASKSAQNQFVRTLSIEWKRTRPRATCLLLHPGTVDTGLSQPFRTGLRPASLFDPDRAARQLLDLIAQVTPADTGRFIAWDGRDIPW